VTYLAATGERWMVMLWLTGDWVATVTADGKRAAAKERDRRGR
jgi:hypothetical protein